MSGAEEVFGERTASESKELDAEKLHAKIGRLTMENDFLAKALGRGR
jgi:transposase